MGRTPPTDRDVRDKPAPEVVCVVTAFNPPPDLPDRLLKLRNQVDRIIIVDDGSLPEAQATFDRLLGLNFKVVRHEANRGIAAALNTGVKWALSKGNVEAIVTLDQDSQLADSYVELCKKAQSLAESAGRPLGILCAASMNGIAVSTRSRGKRIEPYDPMQSGMYILRSTFDTIGLFNEDLFIDAVDSEFVLRARCAGLSVEFAPDTDLAHGLGITIPKVIFGLRVKNGHAPSYFSAHSPIRLYYITRNRATTNSRYFLKDPLWVARRVYDDTMLLGRNLIFGPHKRKSVRAVTLGITHAILNKSGKLGSSHSDRLTLPKRSH